VNAALGTAVGAPQSDVNGSVTVCTYKSINPPQSVIVRIDTTTEPRPSLPPSRSSSPRMRPPRRSPASAIRPFRPRSPPARSPTAPSSS
jgi:hypothetical protein